jgi:threonine aldolase
MRQIGFLSACAAYALTHHIPLLPSVHQKAKHLANELIKLGMRVTVPVDTCMVWFDAGAVGLRETDIAQRARMLEDGIEMFEDGRLVLHLQTSDHAIADLVTLIRTMLKESEEGNIHSSHSVPSKRAYGAKL